MNFPDLEAIIAILRNEDRNALLLQYEKIIKGASGPFRMSVSSASCNRLSNMQIIELNHDGSGPQYLLTGLGIRIACLLGSRAEAEFQRREELKRRIFNLKDKLNEAGLREYYGQFLPDGWSLSHSVNDMEYWEALLLELYTTHKREVAIFA